MGHSELQDEVFLTDSLAIAAGKLVMCRFHLSQPLSLTDVRDCL